MNHTPEIHRRLGNLISIDLGLNDVRNDVKPIGAIRTDVTQIKADVDAGGTLAQGVAAIKMAVQTNLPATLAVDVAQIKADVAPQGQIAQNLGAVLTRIGTAQVDLLTDFDNRIKASADDIVRRLGRMSPKGHIVIEDASAPLVRLLIQAQANALDRTPGDPSQGGAMGKLRTAAKRRAPTLASGPDNLGTRFVQAFDDFASTDLAYRSKRFDEMDGLIHAVADYLSTP